jgi:imidazolonepropionase-like amidohydrolase
MTWRPQVNIGKLYDITEKHKQKMMNGTVLKKNNTLVIAAGWLIDGTGVPTVRNVLIEVSRGVIRSIRKDEPGTRKHAAQIVELLHCSILPGLIDSHVHISMSGTMDPEARKRQLASSFGAARRRIDEHLILQGACGVLGVRDGGDQWGHALRYKSAYATGRNRPVRLETAGKAWHAPGRYGAMIGRSPRKDLGLARSILQTKERGDLIKIVNSGPNSLRFFGRETAPQFSLEELRGAVQAGHSMGLKVMVHANGQVPVGLAVEAGCDSIEHGYFMGKDNLKRMAERGITWVPTLFAMEALSKSHSPGRPEREIAKRTLDHQLELVRAGRAWGVSMAAGTDAGSPGVDHGRAIIEEIRLLLCAGLPLEEAVRCASARGAALLGLEDGTAVVSPGSPATFVAARGGPEDLPQSLRDPEGVFIGGVPVGGMESRSPGA